MGIVVSVEGIDDFTIQTSGRIATLSGLTAGSVYYLDDDTAGLLTLTEPPDVGDVSKPLLIADTTTSGWIFNMRGFIVTAAGGGDAWSEFAYAEFTATASITATTEGTAQQIVSVGSKTYDGTTSYCFEFFSPTWANSVTTTDLFIILYDGSASLGWLWVGRSPAATFAQGSIFASRKITPAAGTRTYSIRGYMSATSTGSVVAGAGGSAAYMPGFVRVVEV